MLKKVISGGQTGVDFYGISIAKDIGIPTGGMAPRGYMTENGPNSSLKHIFGLSESVSSYYSERTYRNVINSDGTIIFGNITSAGTVLTISYLKQEGKKYIINPTVGELVKWINDWSIQILNVAGNRGSRISQAEEEEIRLVLKTAFKQLYAKNRDNSRE